MLETPCKWNVNGKVKSNSRLESYTTQNCCDLLWKLTWKIGYCFNDEKGQPIALSNNVNEDASDAVD